MNEGLYRMVRVVIRGPEYAVGAGRECTVEAAKAVEDCIIPL